LLYLHGNGQLLERPGGDGRMSTLDLAPNLLLIPGTSSRPHLAQNLAAAHVRLDEQARRELSVDHLPA
jgi:hypothetical protein